MRNNRANGKFRFTSYCWCSPAMQSGILMTSRAPLVSGVGDTQLSSPRPPGASIEIHNSFVITSEHAACTTRFNHQVFWLVQRFLPGNQCPKVLCVGEVWEVWRPRRRRAVLGHMGCTTSLVSLEQWASYHCPAHSSIARLRTNVVLPTA